jgi:hypothetical protein
MKDEEDFLLHLVIRLRGIRSFAETPEVQTVLRELATRAEERLEALGAEKLRKQDPKK